RCRDRGFAAAKRTRRRCAQALSAPPPRPGLRTRSGRRRSHTRSHETPASRRERLPVPGRVSTRSTPDRGEIRPRPHLESPPDALPQGRLYLRPRWSATRRTLGRSIQPFVPRDAVGDPPRLPTTGARPITLGL